MKLGLPLSKKRTLIYDDNQVWVDTQPKDVIDIGNHDANTIIKYEVKINDDIYKKKKYILFLDHFIREEPDEKKLSCPVLQ